MSIAFKTVPTAERKLAGNEHVGFRAWYLVFVVVLAVLLSYIDRGVMALFGHAIQNSLSLSDTQLGLLYGLGFIVPLALASLIVGWAIDSVNRVMMMLGGLLLWSMMTAACGLADSFTWLLVARGGIGAGESVLVPAAYALIGDRFPPSHRGRAVGIVSAAVSVGAGSALLFGGVFLHLLGSSDRHLAFLGPLLGSRHASVHPWQITFLALGALGLPIALLMLSLRDPRPVGYRRSQADTSKIGMVVYLQRNALTFAAIFGGATINVMVGTGVMAWSPTLLLRRFGTTPAEAGFMLGLATVIGGIVGSPLAAELSDCWVRNHRSGGRLRGHPWFLAILAAGAAGLALAPTAGFSAACIVLVAAALGAVNAVSYAAIQDLTPEPIRGRMLATMQFVTLAFGYGLGPSTIALVTDHLFGNRQMLPRSLLVVALPLCAGAAALALLARRAYGVTQAHMNEPPTKSSP